MSSSPNYKDGIIAPKHITNRPINDPTLRKAIYKAFHGKCFYTGRSVSFKNMHIDHVEPKSKGGEDCVYNYVLSCPDINCDKVNRCDPEILQRLHDTVKLVYAPVVIKYIRKIESGLSDDEFFDSTLYWNGGQGEDLLNIAFRDKIMSDVDFIDDESKEKIFDILEKVEDSFKEKLTLEFEKTMELFRNKMIMTQDELVEQVTKNVLLQIKRQFNIENRLRLIERSITKQLNIYFTMLQDNNSNRIQNHEDHCESIPEINTINIFDTKTFDENKIEYEKELNEFETSDQFDEIDYNPLEDNDDYHKEKYLIGTNTFQYKFIRY